MIQSQHEIDQKMQRFEEQLAELRKEADRLRAETDRLSECVRVANGRTNRLRDECEEMARTIVQQAMVIRLAAHQETRLRVHIEDLQAQIRK